MLYFRSRPLVSLLLGGLLAAAILGCSAPAATPTVSAPPTVAPVTNTAAVPTSAPAASVPTTAPTNAPAPTAAPQPGATETTSADPTAAPSANADETVVLVVVPEKSEARYRVREQLANVSLPNDAIGKTNAITGQIVGKMDGTIVSAESQFVVDVTTLKSDQGMRDGFIQRTPLQTSQYPTVTFVPTSAQGLPLIPPVPESGAFQLIGDLTIRDVTRPVTWEATCKLESNQTEGLCTATTSFTFDDFQLEQPRVGRVVSIEDTIKLEVDLYLQRVTP
jgi:polyisoprenoid-binding protein YceI